MYIEKVRPVNIVRFSRRGVTIPGVTYPVPGDGEPYVILKDGRAWMPEEGDMIVSDEEGKFVEILTEKAANEKYERLNVFPMGASVSVLSAKIGFSNVDYEIAFNLLKKEVLSGSDAPAGINLDTFRTGSSVLVNLSELDSEQAPMICAALMGSMVAKLAAK